MKQKRALMVRMYLNLKQCGNLYLVDYFFVAALLLSNKSFALGKPVSFPLSGAKTFAG